MNLNQRECMAFIKKVKHDRIKQIKERLNVYTKHRVVPTLEEHGTKTFNLFSKIY